MRIDTTGETQVTIPRVAQITVTEDSVTIDLAGPSIQIVQNGSRLTLQLHRRLAYVAPEERGNVAEELGLPPNEYIRVSNV